MDNKENTVEDNVTTVGYSEDEGRYRKDLVEMLEGKSFRIFLQG